MVSVLGPPPLDYLERSEISWKYFDAHGQWKSASRVPQVALEDLEQHLEGDSKACFLSFTRKTLQWRPEDRPSAGELLKDPWLQ